jgi:hypothetical protein
VEYRIEFVSDERLERLVRLKGPSSVPARVLRQLQSARARDRQFFAFRVGNYWLAGPPPDAETEVAMIELAEADADLA